MVETLSSPQTALWFRLANAVMTRAAKKTDTHFPEGGDVQLTKQETLKKKDKRLRVEYSTVGDHNEDLNLETLI